MALSGTAALVACGGGGDGDAGAGSSGAAAAPPAATSAPQPGIPVASDEDAARFLLQAQFSASDADIAAVRFEGYAGWLQRQFQAPPGGTAWDWLESRGYGVADGNGYYDNTYPADYALWHQLMTAPDAVRQRCALALSEFFVVSLSGLDIEWRSHAIAHYWDTLAAQAFGNFRALLEAVTLNPAMGQFLNTRGNQKEDGRGRQPDENYAREVMQLFTLGVSQLNSDGTPKLDGQGRPIDSYSAADVTHLARVFTGWDFDRSVNPTTNVNGRNVGSTAVVRKPMALTASRHSTLAATFLGTTIGANTEGRAALTTALDTLFHHPNVGPFFARQMIQRLVTSNPTPSYVARVAAAFDHDGAGVRGNLAAVFAAVLLDREARSPDSAAQPGFGKLREPMLRLVQWGRTFGIQSARGSWKIGDLSRPDNQLGQSPLRASSVFNFFRPGYIPPSTALASAQASAPEFQLVNETSVGGYLNFLQNLVLRGLFVNAPDQPQSGSNASNGYDITVRHDAERALVADAPALVARLNLLLCAGQLPAPTVALVVNALNATPVSASSTDAVKLNRIAAAVLLVMASAPYLIQK